MFIIISVCIKQKENVNLKQKECLFFQMLFTTFLLEHNLPIATSDHFGHLLTAMFPKSEEARAFAIRCSVIEPEDCGM